VAPRRVVVLPQPDWAQAPASAAFGDPLTLTAQIRSFNAILAEESRRAGFKFVDLFPLMQEQARAARFASDGLHPAAEAHAEWARELAGALARPCQD
jgi:lysophospholipase L1-like esterase